MQNLIKTSIIFGLRENLHNHPGFPEPLADTDACAPYDRMNPFQAPGLKEGEPHKYWKVYAYKSLGRN